MVMFYEQNISLSYVPVVKNQELVFFAEQPCEHSDLGEGGRCNGATISMDFWDYFGATQPILMRVSETYSCMIGSITSRLALVYMQDWFCMMNSTSIFWLVSF